MGGIKPTKTGNLRNMKGKKVSANSEDNQQIVLQFITSI